VHPMLPVTLDCPFFITPSVFSNIVYPMLPVTLDCPIFIGVIKNGQSRVTGNIGCTTLEKTEGVIKNGQSRVTDNIGYTTLEKTEGAIKNGQSSHWQHWVHNVREN
jgi:cytoskeletal protein CcmA (bactofilin family)